MPRHRDRSWLRSALALYAVVGLSVSASADPEQDFMLHCMGCHAVNAQGVPGKVPPLAHSLIEFMRTPAGRNYVLRVPGASNSMLSDERLADVLNWIALHFDGDRATGAWQRFTPAEVTASRHAPLVSVKAARQAVIDELAATGPAPSAIY